MTEEYILMRDVRNDHKERMKNVKKYYPYFKLADNDFSLFQGGKYQCLDMGYILMAVLRFFIEENNFKEKDVTYEEYSSFVKELYERDFGLTLEKAEEESLSSYIFEKIRNEGKPFVFSYFDPEEKKKKSLRLRFIESRIKNDTIYYYLTADALSFYLDTKEVKDESVINVSQILLSKMIASKNFKGGMEVVRRINNQVIRLKMQVKEVLKLLGSDVFQGVKAYEDFMEHGVRWFDEEQKMFAKNMELIDEALRRADSEQTYGQAVKDIYDLEHELNRALINHSELLNDCTKLQIQADEMIARAKFSKLKKGFDFQTAMGDMMKQNDASLLEQFILPVLKPHISKSFPLLRVDDLLTLRMEREERGEVVKETHSEQDYVSDDEVEAQRIRENYILYVRLFLYYVSVQGIFTLEELQTYFVEILGEAVLKNSDYYSFLIHLSQKGVYRVEDILKKPDTFLEEYIKTVVEENPQYQQLEFMLVFDSEQELKVSEDCVVTDFKVIRRKSRNDRLE